MELRKRFLRAANLLFIVLLAVQFLPDRVSKDPKTAFVIWFAVGAEVLVLLVSALIRKPQGLNLFLDIIGFLFSFLTLWTLATAKFDLLKESLFPPPGRVFAQFIEDWDKILVNIRSSLGIILQGYLLAALIAIPLGLFLGWTTGRSATGARWPGRITASFWTIRCLRKTPFRS